MIKKKTEPNNEDTIPHNIKKFLSSDLKNKDLMLFAMMRNKGNKAETQSIPHIQLINGYNTFEVLGALEMFKSKFLKNHEGKEISNILGQILGQVLKKHD